jgi:hypothetical protein
MKCNHCRVEFHAQRVFTPIGQDVDAFWGVTEYTCPKCGKLNLFLVSGKDEETKTLIRPKGASRPFAPPEVPSGIAEDYNEACLVLADSPKASAALSRRCLQHLIREVVGIKPKSLAKEIDEILNSNDPDIRPPTNIASLLDAIRHIGNFAAHPEKSQNTGEIVPVNPDEAETNLDILAELFDHYCVRPARAKEKRDNINAKLAEAGKPQLKQRKETEGEEET